MSSASRASHHTSSSSSSSFENVAHHRWHASSAVRRRSTTRATTTTTTTTNGGRKYAMKPRREIKAPEIGERTGLIPYFNDEREKCVYVGDAGRDKIARTRAGDFVALPHEEKSEALKALREVIEDGWKTHEMIGCGHAGAWPEIFESAKELIREQFPQFGADCEILPGTGWLEDESRAIDWVIRRPEKHIIASKIHFATRLHRDPDSWTNPATKQRPRDGWPNLSMPNRERYQYRFINVHLTTSALDPTGNAWQSPLVVMLPREGGQREWAFEKRKLSMTAEGAKDENNFDDKINIFNPKTWIIGGNRLTRGAYKSTSKSEEELDDVDEGLRGEDGLTDAERAFEFPEVKHEEAQEFVTNGALVFDSFDLWHGAAKWNEDKSFKKKLTDIDPKGREPFHSARCSIEMRFRVRIDMESEAAKTLRWGPFTSAVRDGKFLTENLRDSEARYDLDSGCIVR